MWRLMPDEGPPGTPVTIEVRLFFSSYPPYTKNWYDWYGRGDGSTLYAEGHEGPAYTARRGLRLAQLSC